MKKLSIITMIIGLIVSCGNPKTKEKENIPQEKEVVKTKKYTIRKEEPNTALNKDNLEIILKSKIEKSELKKIAEELHNNRKQYEKLWIFYYLNEEDNTAWAISHYTPELELKIMGSTINEDKNSSYTDDINGEIIGKWRSEKSLSGSVLVLYKNKKNKLIMKTIFKNGQSMEDKITKKSSKGNTTYNDGNSFGEYYQDEKNGNLGMYGKDGKYDEAVILK